MSPNFSISTNSSSINFLLIFSLCITNLSHSSNKGYTSENDKNASPTSHNLTSDELKTLQKEFLDLLGLQKIPERNKNFHTKPTSLLPDDLSHLSGGHDIPNFMQDMYRTLEQVDSRQSEEEQLSKLDQSQFRKLYNLSRVVEKNVFEADVIISVKKARLALDYPRYALNPLEASYFPLSSLQKDGNLRQAEIRLFRTDKGRHPTQNLKLTLFRIRKYSAKGIRFHKHRIEVTISRYKSGWFEIDVSKWARKWTENPSRNMGIYIIFRTLSGAYINPRQTNFILETDRSNSPLLVAFFQSNQEARITVNHKRRQKRSPSNSMWAQQLADQYQPYYDQNYYVNKLGDNKSCLRREFRVKFKDLGWDDWLIAPRHYDAFYCLGECKSPLAAHHNATNHALIQASLHVLSSTKVPLPCCVPTRLKSVNILYSPDDKNVFLRKYKNMVVEECGCK